MKSESPYRLPLKDSMQLLFFIFTPGATRLTCLNVRLNPKKMQHNLPCSIDFNLNQFTRLTLCLSLLFLLTATSQKIFAQATCAECDHYITNTGANENAHVITWDA